MRVLIAACLTPGIYAIEKLIQRGLAPGELRLLSERFGRNEPLLAFAKNHGIELWTARPDTDETISQAAAFQPDLILSLYYRRRIPGELLELALCGAVNLHPSLLPKYRGGFSAPWAIMNGESEAGFTYHYMVEEFDAGPIVLQDRIPISSSDTAYSLYHRVIDAGIGAFGEMWRLVVDERVPGRPQSGQPSVYGRDLPNNGLIDPSWDRARIDRLIRATYFPPHPLARVASVDGQMLEVACIQSYDALVSHGKVAMPSQETR